MAYFAQLNENNEVLQVIVVEDRECLNNEGVRSEEIGINFCQSLFGGTWVETFDDRSKRINFAGIGMVYFPEHDAFMPNDRLYPWYEIGPDGRWRRPPGVNDLTGEPFTHDELCYIGYYSRNTKFFCFSPAIPLDPTNSFFSIACTTIGNYMYPMFSEVETGKNIVQETTGAYIEDGVLHMPEVTLVKNVVDATPVGVIQEVHFSLFLDEMFHYHPQSLARTLHELFRLIIEWAYAHTEFGNNELAAKRCYELLQHLNMPNNVREDLINHVPPQAVELYIRGEDPFQATSFDIITDPPCPESFDVWYQSIKLPTTTV